jgi:hypothetical protein
MEKLSYWRLIGEIEKLVKECVPGSHPKNWEERHITESLLRGLCNGLNDLPVSGFRQDFIVQWEAFRGKSGDSAQNGDIALLVRIANRDGGVLEGAAFMDAKIKTDRKRTFEEFRLPDFKRILRNSPSAQVLLYDYEDITSYTSNRSVMFPPLEYSPWRGGVPITPCTYAVLAPAGLVVQRHINDTDLYKFSLPLSYQLIYRYCHGFDLDFSEQSLAAARGFPTRKGISAYLLCLSVTEEGADTQPRAELALNRSSWKALE